MSTDCSSCGTSFADCDALPGRRSCCPDCALARGRIHEPGVRLRRPQGYAPQPGTRRGVDLVLVIRILAAVILLTLVLAWIFR
jgi:hypothetical protein